MQWKEYWLAIIFGIGGTKRIIKKKKFRPHCTWVEVSRRLEDYYMAQAAGSIISYRHRQPIRIDWDPPKSGRFKLNTDIAESLLPWDVEDYFVVPMDNGSVVIPKVLTLMKILMSSMMINVV